MQSRTKIEQVVELARRQGVLRPRDLEARSLPREYLGRLVKRGLLRKVGRGLYCAADFDFSEHHVLAQVAKAVPKGVVCLLSALRFHEITTQSPGKVWLAIGHGAFKPNIEYPPIRFVRFSGKALDEGILEERIEGTIVKIYGPAKTVADCFKYRNKIGLDVAIEALRDCWTKKKATMDEIWRFAKVCRVSNVMRPYLEAITT